MTSGGRPTDDLIPPAKKRASDRQITKDDDPDEEDDELDVDPNNFEKASEEVLKARKIVKARRGGAGLASSTAPDAPPAAANPFANIALAPAAVRALHNKTTPRTAHNTQAASPAAKDESSSAPKNPPKPSGFAALASFGTSAGGFAGGGFAAAAASVTGFGAVAATSAAVDGFSFAANAGPKPFADTAQQFSFVTPVVVEEPTEDNPQPVVKSVFGAPDGTKGATHPPTNQPAEPAMPLQDAKTGEEDEQAVFTAQGTLFEFDASKTWRERGRGEMRVNVPKEGSGAARLVMRSKGNLRLLMNASLWPDMVVTKMDDGKGATFACLNAAAATDGEGGDTTLSTWAVRIKPTEQLDAFIASVEKHKGSAQAA